MSRSRSKRAADRIWTKNPLNRHHLLAQLKPISIWTPIEGLTGGRFAYDLIGQNHGTLNGGITTTASGFGTLGQSWAIGTTSSYWKIAGLAVSPPVTLFTVAKNTTPTTFQFAVACDTGLNNGFRLGIDNTGALSFTLGGVFDYKFTSLVLSANTTYFMAATWTGNGGTAVGYLSSANAVLSQSLATGSMSGAPSQVTVGGMQASANSWEGTIGIAGIFSGILTAAQVSALYNCLRTGQPFPLFNKIKSRSISVNVPIIFSGDQNTRRSATSIGLVSNIIYPVPDGQIKDSNSDGSDLRHIAGIYRGEIVVLQNTTIIVSASFSMQLNSQFINNLTKSTPITLGSELSSQLRDFTLSKTATVNLTSDFGVFIGGWTKSTVVSVSFGVDLATQITATAPSTIDSNPSTFCFTMYICKEIDFTNNITKEKDFTNYITKEQDFDLELKHRC